MIKEEDFKVKSITSEKYFFDEVISPSNIGLVGRKVLLFEEMRVPQEYPRIHIIDSNDWTYDKPKGKPLWKLMLDRSINNFVINEYTNEIYGLTTDEDPGIAVFKIPKELL
jgi:hypothetical protein